MIPKRRQGVRYEVNVCGGGFDSVKSHFNAWKQEPLIYRPERRMFEGKANGRPLGDETFGSTEPARFALQHACDPSDPYALAARVRDDGRELWLVMAAYDAWRHALARFSVNGVAKAWRAARQGRPSRVPAARMDGTRIADPSATTATMERP